MRLAKPFPLDAACLPNLDLDFFSCVSWRSFLLGGGGFSTSLWKRSNHVSIFSTHSQHCSSDDITVVPLLNDHHYYRECGRIREESLIKELGWEEVTLKYHVILLVGFKITDHTITPGLKTTIYISHNYTCNRLKGEKWSHKMVVVGDEWLVVKIFCRTAILAVRLYSGSPLKWLPLLQKMWSHKGGVKVKLGVLLCVCVKFWPHLYPFMRLHYLCPSHL